ncbi:MAG: MraY family glycosyltransferase [bacterium]
MTVIMLAFVVALVAALVFTPLVRAVARRAGFVDKPSMRKLHAVPIPLLGGVAIYAAVVGSILILGRHDYHIRELLSIIIGATLMAFLGLWDDRVALPAFIKLAFQFFIVAGLYVAGVRVHLGGLPLWVNFLLTVVWCLTICNAINFLDNMDGLCAGISGIAAAFFTLLAAMNGQVIVSILAAALLGGCAGFVYYNRRPASIFMGDAGSLLLGLLLAVAGIKLRFPANSNFVTWMVPVFILAVPIFDTTLVFVSRIRRGVNPFTTAGKDHMSHRLVERGMTHMEAVLVLCVAAFFCGLLAIFIMQANEEEGYQVGVTAACVGAWVLWKQEWRRTGQASGGNQGPAGTSGVG